jgi:hypothetical protein
MPSMLLLVIGLSAPGYAPLIPRPCIPPVHEAVPDRFATPVSEASRDRAPHLACPFVALPARDVRAVAVRVYSSGQAIDQTRSRDAERIAARILRQGGVAVEWLACDRRDAKADRQHPCDVPPAPGDVIVRLAKSTTRSPAGALGFSYVPGIVATALVDRIQDTALRTGVPSATLLGAVIAHEIAHLLTGSQHARDGLMRAVWSDRDIQRRAPSLFRIDRAQRTELRAALDRRGMVPSGSDAVLTTITDGLRSRTAGPGP